MLIIKDYVKNYKHGFKLSKENLRLDPGLHFLKGQNGSGKSTLLKSISGLIQFKGSISFNDVYLHRNSNTFKRQIGFAAAEPEFPSFLTLNQLAGVVLEAKKARNEEYEVLLNTFGVEFQEQPVATYSSGMLKKTSLILALIGKPDLLLLDEPFTTIDSQSKEILTRMVKGMLKEGRTILFSSHDNMLINQIQIDTLIEFKQGKIMIT